MGAGFFRHQEFGVEFRGWTSDMARLPHQHAVNFTARSSRISHLESLEENGRILHVCLGVLPCPSFLWFIGIPCLIVSKAFPCLFVCVFLWVFPRFGGFGSGQKSLVNLRVFLGKQKNQ